MAAVCNKRKVTFVLQRGSAAEGCVCFSVCISVWQGVHVCTRECLWFYVCASVWQCVRPSERWCRQQETGLHKQRKRPASSLLPSHKLNPGPPCLLAAFRRIQRRWGEALTNGSPPPGNTWLGWEKRISPEFILWGLRMGSKVQVSNTSHNTTLLMICLQRCPKESKICQCSLWIHFITVLNSEHPLSLSFIYLWQANTSVTLNENCRISSHYLLKCKLPLWELQRTGVRFRWLWYRPILTIGSHRELAGKVGDERGILILLSPPFCPFGG